MIHAARPAGRRPTLGTSKPSRVRSRQHYQSNSADGNEDHNESSTL